MVAISIAAINTISDDLAWRAAKQSLPILVVEAINAVLKKEVPDLGTLVPFLQMRVQDLTRKRRRQAGAEKVKK